MTHALRTLLAAACVLSLASSVDAKAYPWLGVRIRDLAPEEMDEISQRHGVREGFGVYLVDIVQGAPAEGAGLQRGDIVVAVNGRPIVETRLLQRLLVSQGVDDDVKLTVLRAEGRRDVSVRLALMPPTMVGERMAAELGFVLREAAGQRGSATAPAEARAVVAVMKGTPADKAGLAAGDVIVAVNGRSAPGGVAVRQALADSAPAVPVRLTVWRSGEERTVTLDPP